jgi:hypothetical protein
LLSGLHHREYGNHAANGKIDVLDWLTGRMEHSPSLHRNFFEIGLKPRKVVGPEPLQKAVFPYWVGLLHMRASVAPSVGAETTAWAAWRAE